MRKILTLILLIVNVAAYSQKFEKLAKTPVSGQFCAGAPTKTELEF